MFNSIKTRLFIWLISSFAVILTTLGFFLYNRLDSIVRDMVDHLLADKSEILKGLIHVEKGEVEFEISEVTAGDYSVKNSGHYFEVIDGSGISLVKSKSLCGSTLSSVNTTGFFNTKGPGGEPIRLLVEELNVGDKRLLIYVAEGIKAELNLLRSFRTFLLFTFPVTILFLGIGSVVITWSSLKPLSSFSQQIGRITEKRLHDRVDSQGVEAELKGLASSFNETMDRLEKAFQAQRDFLSDASHELRTPVSVIKTATDVTLRRERSIEEYREALGTVKASAERMGGLIDRLLRLSRFDAEQAGPKRERVRLKDVLGTTLKAIYPLAEEKGMKIVMGKMEDLSVKGDRDQLSELFLSIIDNAIKYNREKGSVNISLTCSDKWAVVKVADSGIGIAPDVLNKVFDRFYRADMSRSEIPGTGLGLPIAKGIAESHGGRIEVESEIDKGTTFLIYIPVV